MAGHHFAAIYCSYLRRWRYGIFLFWLLIVGCGLKWGRKFTGETTSQYTSAHDSPSQRAARKISHFFPAQKNTQSVTILLQQKSGTHATRESFLELTKSVELKLYNASRDKYNYRVEEPDTNGFFRSMQSYWLLVQEFNATELADQFVASDSGGEWSTTITVTYDTKNKDKYNHLVDWLQKTVKQLIRDASLKGQVDNGACGIVPFATAILDGVQEDLEFMDSAVLPLALLILATIIQSLTLMIIPIVNILVAILGQFLAMYPVAISMDVVSFTPSLMMSITIAMSIDYSLFLLSRFREEIAAGKTVEEAIPIMINGAGHTILVSGGTLVCCFLSMLTFPLDMLRSVGIGASMSLFFCLFVNLSLTPAILYSIGNELMAAQDQISKAMAAFMLICCKSCVDVDESQKTTTAKNLTESLLEDNEEVVGQVEGAYTRVPEEEGNGVENSESAEKNPIEDDDDRIFALDANARESSRFQLSTKSSFSDYHLSLERTDEDDVSMSNSFFFRLACHLLQPKRGLFVLLLVIALAAPVCRFCLSVDISISFDFSVPDQSKTYDTFKSIEKSFGAGAVFPYTLLFVPDDNAKICDGGGLICEEGFNKINYVLNEVQKKGEKHSDIAFYLGLTRLGSSYGPVKYTQYYTALQDQEQHDLSSLDSSLLLIYEGFYAADSSVTQVTIALEEDPYSPSGVRSVSGYVPGKPFNF